MSDENGSGAEPKIDPSAWIAPTAQLYGAIEIGRDVSVWHNAVLRAECQRIEIGRMTNLQDFAMVHIAYDNPTRIGDFCSITHKATVHGCTVGDHCLVGIGAVIMDHAVIGEGSIVAGGAFVTERSVFPPHSIIAGVPAKQIGERDCARLRARQPSERLGVPPQRRVHPSRRLRSVDGHGIPSLAGGKARGDRSRSRSLRSAAARYFGEPGEALLATKKSDPANWAPASGAQLQPITVCPGADAAKQQLHGAFDGRPAGAFGQQTVRPGNPGADRPVEQSASRSQNIDAGIEITSRATSLEDFRQQADGAVVERQHTTCDAGIGVGGGANRDHGEIRILREEFVLALEEFLDAFAGRGGSGVVATKVEPSLFL